MPHQIAAAISEHIREGKLAARSENRPLGNFTFADTRRPYGDFFTLHEEAGKDGLDNKSLKVYGGFQAVPRRSRRPLDRVRQVLAPEYRPDPSYWKSLQAILGFYEQEPKIVKPEDLRAMLDHSLAKEHASIIIAPLGTYLVEWGLEAGLEDPAYYFNEGPIQLWLPFFDYNCESAGAVEAFLSGPRYVAHLLEYMVEEHDILGLFEKDGGLPEEDARMIRKMGMRRLISAYVKAPGPKALDLKKLSKPFENFFRPVYKKHSFLKKRDVPLISQGQTWGHLLPITEPGDIRAAIDYTKAFYELSDHLPDCWGLTYNEDCELVELLGEICRVVRGEKTNPKGKPLAQVFKEEEENSR